MNIVLIGPRGAGKSKLARQLALATKRSVLSTDQLIAYDNQGRSIPQIVEEEGWPRFRELEFAVVEKVARLDNIIIDAGGGVVVDLDATGAEQYSERKISLLRHHGFLVWLRGDPARLAQKVARDPRRPTLNGALGEEAVMRRRAPFYEQAAHMTLDLQTMPDRARQCQELLWRFFAVTDG